MTDKDFTIDYRAINCPDLQLLKKQVRNLMY